ncbi:succinylglutamate desuccinylase/aspartoacylase family protein [Micrococcus luteus]|uniref:succinylglutamate desuccinylase/aspartoacylase family protein n=1 Tax=Micrococcus luteus TaxID=1270 RepID=UPI001E3E9B96|nr:succinylglutamate desuccinylase/aspartoacylase family protein [Micrococcus luteus]MCD0173137.1 succinylglutamate desuccinylase/aspartoacylase family protein [Micrococcus luteus]
MSRRPARAPFAFGGVEVAAGRRHELSLPISQLVTGADVTLPVHVLHGREDGPTVWVSAAIHGDEVAGVEIVRRVLERLQPKNLRGTLLAVPIVNVLGVMAGDRYLPDRRDLNRSFPGSARGSLASRIAHLMMTEVIGRCTVGIDLHTGADRRSNLPQIRCDLEDPQTRALAEAFGAPVLFHARLRDGSLRAAARETGARVLLYEAGEAWRFDEYAIAPGVDGVLRVLAHLGMVRAADVGLTPGDDEVPPAVDATGENAESVETDPGTHVVWRSGWVRARADGLLHLDVALGQTVRAGERIGALYNSFGRRLAHVSAELSGVVVGRAEAPLVHRGDALVHIGELDGRPTTTLPAAEPVRSGVRGGRPSHYEERAERLP